MSNDDWCVIREFPNYAGAEIIKNLFVNKSSFPEGDYGGSHV